LAYLFFSVRLKHCIW